MTDDEQKESGFCPKIVEAFLLRAKVVFGVIGEELKSLAAIWKNLTQRQHEYALWLIKVMRVRGHPEARMPMFAVLEQFAYQQICPHT